jgi:hypothetical protein
VRRDPILFAVVWGVVTWAFGVPQNQILPGGPKGMAKLAIWCLARLPSCSASSLRAQWRRN